MAVGSTTFVPTAWYEVQLLLQHRAWHQRLPHSLLHRLLPKLQRLRSLPHRNLQVMALLTTFLSK